MTFLRDLFYIYFYLHFTVVLLIKSKMWNRAWNVLSVISNFECINIHGRMTNSDLTVTSFERNGFVNLTLTKLSKHLLKTSIEFFFLDFYRASICEGGLGSRNSVCPFVRPSVCLLHAWIVTNLNGALQIFWYHTKGQSLCYSDTNSGWWATPPSLRNLRSKWPTPFRKTPTSTDFRSCLLYTSDAADE